MIMNSKIGKELIELLGLPEGTIKFEVVFGVNEPVTVNCTYYPKWVDMQKILVLLNEGGMVK